MSGAQQTANSRQVSGNHYKTKIEHWDYVIANEIPYLEAQIIKYVTRWRKKGGVPDLEKAKHFIEKLIETETPPPIPANVSPSGVEFVEDQYCNICDTTRGVQGACCHQLREDMLRNELPAQNSFDAEKSRRIAGMLLEEIEKNKPKPDVIPMPTEVGVTQSPYNTARVVASWLGGKDRDRAIKYIDKMEREHNAEG